MKKSLLLLGCLLALAGCSNNNEEKPSPSPEPVEEEQQMSWAFNYSNEVTFLESYDTSEITLKVNLPDGNVVSVENEDLIFDTEPFNSSNFTGKTKILVSCPEYEIEDELVINIKPRTDYKILFFGNSFSDNVITNMKQISNDLGISSKIGNLNIGGSSLSNHLYQLATGYASYTYTNINENGVKENTSGVKATVGLNKEDWDFISLQQNTALVGQHNSYDCLNSLVKGIWEELPSSNHAQFVFHSTWAVQADCDNAERFEPYNWDQNYMYQCAIECLQEEVLTSPYFKAIIPNATSMQNARSSFVGDVLTTDGYHANLLGRFVIGLTAVKSLTGCDLTQLTYRPEGVSELEQLMAIEAATNACLKPFEVSKSSYQEGPKEEIIDVENDKNYKKLDIDWIDGNYYNRMQSSNLSNDPAASNKFVCTPIYKRTDLPIGTILNLDPNYGVRRHAWETLTTKYDTREDMYDTTVKQIVVDYAFWGEYKYFAFNVSKRVVEALPNFDGVHAALSIYVPINPVDDGDDPIYHEGEEEELVRKTIDWIDGNYYSRVTSGSSLANDPAAKTKYCCTPIFTKEDLPNGSKLVITSGWRVLRHAWETLTTTYTTKEDPYSALTIFVNDSFWGVYNYCAFNVCKNNYAALENFDEAHGALKIYVPKNSESGGEIIVEDPYKDFDKLTINWNDGTYISRPKGTGLVNDPAAKNKWCCTQYFTPEDIPVGSKLVMLSGWVIRRCAFETMESKYENKETEYKQLVVDVDSSWWGVYKFAAFNVCYTPTAAALENFDVAHTALTIYVPKK